MVAMQRYCHSKLKRQDNSSRIAPVVLYLHSQGGCISVAKMNAGHKLFIVAAWEGVCPVGETFCKPGIFQVTTILAQIEKELESAFRVSA